MLILSEPTSIAGMGDAELIRLLRHRVDALQEFDDYALGDLVRFVVVEPGDSLQDLDAQLGFSARDKPFELLEEHPGYYELVFVVSDDGFGIEVFVPKQPGIDPRLLALCITQSAPSQEQPEP